METEIKNEKALEPIVKNPNDIHTVLVIKDGSLDVWKLEDLTSKNYFFQVHSRINWFALIDYDKTDTVPIVKDILNRQNTFIEIKFLRILLILAWLILIWVVTVGILIPLGKPDFQPVKDELIKAIKNIPSQTPQTATQPQQSVSNIDHWYNPVLPSQTTTWSTNNGGYLPQPPSPITPEITTNTHINVH